MKFTIFLCIGLLLFPVILFPNIEITEIMFNPAGNERTNEFVEIYNCSMDSTVDLTGWFVGDGERMNAILPVNSSLVLLPGQYGLLFTPTYFASEQIYNEQIPLETLLLTIKDTQFGSYGFANDRSESVTLYNKDSLVISTRCYHAPTNDGFSEEKIIIHSGNEDENWGRTAVPGGTPGYSNSLSPVDYDVAVIDTLFSIFPTVVRYGESAKINAWLNNNGTKNSGPVYVCIYDTQPGKDADSTELTSLDITDIPPQTMQELSFEWHDIPAGAHILTVTFDSDLDNNLDNNSASLSFFAGYSSGALIISEIMYSPATGLPEWIELYNPGYDAVNINSWTLHDSSPDKLVSLTDSTFIVHPDSFLVLSNNKDIENMCPSQSLVVKNLPSLNNDQDEIVLYDAAGGVADSLFYSNGMGGGAGISLERINPRASSVKADNWAGCVDPAGNTCGLTNSIFTPTIRSEGSLAVFPDPFSPDEDGFDDRTAISYKVANSTAYINIRIFDINGRMVRFLKNMELSAAEGVCFWDGRDDEGLGCRIGIYIVFFEALDSNMIVFEKNKKTIVLAKKL